MIQITEQIVIQKSGEFKETDFTIDASPELMQVLSSKIYTDPESAVLRELVTNAIDSHTEAKSNKDIEIHLPSRFKQELRIRDYGTGLSEKDISTIYTSFGTSNRRSSNEYCGCLGLGSKSPLSVADAFSVVSYQEGKKNTYSVYKCEKGIKLAKLSTEDTKELNGLEILVPIKQHKINEFHQKAINVYRWFKKKPVVIPKLEYPELKKLYEGDGFYVFPGDYYNKELYVVMGNIGYKSSVDKAGIKDFPPISVVLELNVGDVDISAGREDLYYSERTKAKLRESLDKVIECIRKEVEEGVKKAKCYYEAVCIYKKCPIKVTASYNGKNIETAQKICNIQHLDIRQPGYARRGTSKFRADRYIQYDENKKFYWDDLDKGRLNRVNEQGISNAVYLKPIPYITTTALGDIPGVLPTKKDFADFMGLNESDLILTSSLPKPTIIKTGRGASTTIQLYNGQDNYYQSYNWTDVKVQNTDTIHYVDINRFNPIIKVGEKDKRYIPQGCFNDLLGLLKFYKLIGEVQIYGVRNSFSKKSRKTWVNVGDLFWEQAPLLYAQYGIEQLLIDNNSTFGEYEHFKGLTITHSTLVPLVENVRKIKENLIKRDKELKFWLKCATIIGKTSVGVSYSFNTYLDQKPLLAYINSYDYKNFPVLEYINKEEFK